MKKITLDEQKSVMLEILTYIDQIAEEHDLKYSLWGGSMLGAVRHKGYIPWDDDIDISLPREDYQKLITLIKDSNKYDLYDYSIQASYTQGWAKLADKNTVDRKKKYFNAHLSHGIFVDIMPIDGLPSEDEDIKSFKKKVQQQYHLVRSSHFPSYARSISLKESLKRLILASPLFVTSQMKGGKQKMVRNLEILSRTYPLERSEKCGHLLSRYKKKLGYPSTIWDELTDYEFEGHHFKGISDAHTYLSILYGDNYMELPPKEKQIIHKEHDFFERTDLNEHSYDHGKWQRT